MGFGGSEDFAFAGRGAGEAFGLKADLVQEAPDGAFGAIGGQDGSGFH